MELQVTQIFLRPAGEGEIDAILEVYRQCEDFLALGPQAKATVEMIRGDLEISRQEGGIFCGIFLPEEGLEGGAKMVGVVDYVLKGFEGNPEHAFLSLLMIAAPYRSKGLGAEVVRKIEAEIARDAQVQAILSGVQANNPAAQRFWGKMGYQIVSGPRLMPDTTIAYELRKDLRVR